jgi:lipopolysaccharide/colanic/teichoic acid biosynthesis glycosyltransferase
MRASTSQASAARRPDVSLASLASTELMNRIIRRECARADRNGREFSLVLFRVRSDTRHAVSVYRLARTIMRRVRLTDEVGWFTDRYLCVLLPDTPPTGARAFAEGVCDIISSRKLPRPLAIVYSYPEQWAGQAAESGKALGSAKVAAHSVAILQGAGRFTAGDQIEAAAVAATASVSTAIAPGHNGHGHNGHAHNGHSQNGHGSSFNGAPGRLADEAQPPHARRSDLGTGNVAHEASDRKVGLNRGDLMPFFSEGFTSAMHGTGLPVESLNDFLVFPMPAWKRMLDVFVVLMMAGPALLAVGFAAIGIKLTSPGPVFFKQRRAGLGGRPFTIWKLRTMVTDAEAKKQGLKKLSEQDGPAFKLKNDPRIFPFGKLLRKTSIDELPQLINVLLGDMSLVGPRPLPCDESDACLQWQRRRLDVTPGLTCIWQVKGRSSVTFDQWVRMDVEYIRKRTLLHDLSILLQTVPAVLLRKGAR